MYSNPPSHGVRIVQTVLEDPALYQEWRACIEIMSQRIKDALKPLQPLETGGENENLIKPPSISHITSQIGMFSYVGLTKDQCVWL